MITNTSVSLRKRPVEPLLGPVLSIVSSTALGSARDVARHLARNGFLPGVPREDVENILSEPGQTVVEAIIALKESGLIEPDTTSAWRVTTAGLRVLQGGREITFAALRRRPKYRKYLDRLAAEKRRRDWQALRFDYYVAGRTLTLQGSAHAAPAVLAYAIEYSLKAALTELRPGAVKGRLLHGHDILELYRTCLDHDQFTETYISEDFLQYAQHHFERRYPGGQSRILEKRRHWTFGGGFLSTYDDCMIQLERGLDQLYGTTEWSLGCLALTVPIAECSRAFFHNNVFAVDRLDDYRSSVKERHLSYPDVEHLERPDRLFSSSEQLPYPGVTYQKAQELLSQDLAALFVYPEPTAPHPDPSRTFAARRSSLPGFPYGYEWILKRLRQEFGYPAVEVLEDRRYRNISIMVYDRRAKQYWAELRVTEDSISTLIRNRSGERFLERWIAETKAQFASDRRALRLPVTRASSEKGKG